MRHDHQLSFQGDGDKVIADALDSNGGFTWVLAGLKALLELQDRIKRDRRRVSGKVETEMSGDE